MMQAINKIISILHLGNNSQTIYVSTNPDIDVTIRRVEKDFFYGNFKQAIDDLNDLIESNNGDALKPVKYQLLLLRASFLMQFRKLDEFESLLLHIEKEYSSFIEIKFKELKLTLMSFKKDENFFEFSKQLRMEIPDSKPQYYFDALFYLNSGNILKAKEVFEKEIISTQCRDKLLLIGGHIYSNLYGYIDDSMAFFGQAKQYYEEALKTDTLSFLDKMHIQGFYASYLLRINFQKQIQKENLSLDMQDYRKSLDILLCNTSYFDSNYMKGMIETYIDILLYLGLQDAYNEFYKKYEHNLSVTHYIQYCEINNIEYEHIRIQTYILEKEQVSIIDLLTYSSLILGDSKSDTEEIIKFLQSNINFIHKHSFVLYCYIKGQILLGCEIEAELVRHLNERKYCDIDTILAFIEMSIYLNGEIGNGDIKSLIKLGLDENNLQTRVLEVIKLLERLGKRREYLDLALAKQDVFSEIIFETLKICAEDKNLHFKDFENFINSISRQGYYHVIIGNIYARHDRPDKAFDYYYLEAKKRNSSEIMLATLQTAWDYYNKSHKILEDSKQREIFNLLIAKKEDLNLENIIALLMYSIYILKDTRQVSPIVNQELLNSDIQSLGDNIKVSLSNLHMHTWSSLHNYKDMFLYDANLCLVCNGKTYPESNYTILEANQNNFGFISIDGNEYFLKAQDDNYKEESLFHRIVGIFAFRCENPNMVSLKIKEDSENPFSEFFDFIDDRVGQTRSLFNGYSDGRNYGLNNLAQRDYKNYFTLIPYLLNNKDINFNSLHISYLPKDKKKILTLSSIIFLQEINQLEAVLLRDDVVVQQTLVDWLKDYFQKIDHTNMPYDFSHLDEKEHKIKFLTEDNVRESEKFKDLVLGIISNIMKCPIVNDASENLPIKKAFEYLAPYIGVQEYQALAYCVNHNCQIISEDNIFDILFETRFNKAFISNSIALLDESLDYADYRKLIIDLYNKKYKYVLPTMHIERLLSFMKRYDVLDLKDEEKELIKIASDYGYLKKIEKYYDDKFKVLFPKRVMPTKTFFDQNIEKLFDIVKQNYNN